MSRRNRVPRRCKQGQKFSITNVELTNVELSRVSISAFDLFLHLVAYIYFVYGNCLQTKRRTFPHKIPKKNPTKLASPFTCVQRDRQAVTDQLRYFSVAQFNLLELSRR